MRPAEQGFGAFQVGEFCNQYRISRKLGTTTYEAEYLASEKRLFDRRVALKCLELDQENVDLRRLETILNLHHPHLVRILDVGQNDRYRRLYVVMDLLKGRTLAEHLAAGRFSIRRALSVAIAIAEGLASGHKQGVIHYNVKPRNVFVTDDGKMKLLDYAVVEPFAISYAATEQLDGSDEVDERADVFSLGVVLYEMLTSQHPFRCWRDVRTMGEFIGVQIQARARPLAEFGIPEDVASIVHRALARRPDDRHRSMAEMLAGLYEVGERMSRSSRDMEVQ